MAAAAPPLDSPSDLLRSAAVEARKLPPLDQAEAMKRIATTAASLSLPETRQWVDDLVRSARELDDPMLRVNYESEAAITLSGIDPQLALHRLARIPPASESQDSRAGAARFVLEYLWTRCRQHCPNDVYHSVLLLIRGHVAPYRAIDPILGDLESSYPKTAADLVGLSVRTYRGQPTDDLGFVALLSHSQNPSSRALVREGSDLAVDRLFSDSDDVKSELPAPIVTIGVAANGGPATVQTDLEAARRQLYDLVASYDPDKARSLELEDTSLRLPPPAQPVMGVVYSSRRKLSAAAQFGMSAFMLTERVSSGEVTQLEVDHLLDPLMKAVGLAALSERRNTSMENRKRFLSDAVDIADKAEGSPLKLRVLAQVASAAIKAGDLELAKKLVIEAFAFGPELAERELADDSDGSKKIYDSDSYVALQRLVDLTVPDLTGTTLSETRQIQNDTIRTFLIIRIAQRQQKDN